VLPSLFVAATAVGNTDSLSSATSVAVAVGWLQAIVGNKRQKQRLLEGGGHQTHLNKDGHQDIRQAQKGPSEQMRIITTICNVLE
jgi:hypothetical protein